MAVEFPHVQRPMKIGPHTLKHRVVMTPHGVAWAGGNMPYDRQSRYYVERARGGVALVQTGATSVSSLYADPDQPPSATSDERIVDLYSPFTEQIHSFGAKIFVELAESGVHVPGRRHDGRWGAPHGVSALPSVVQNESPQVYDHAMLASLREDFAAAAVNLLRGGVDGITIHAGHSYLLGQFLSPAYNDRTDEYGGSMANNLRFTREIVSSVRDAVGGDLAVGLRMSYDEFLGDAGITPDMSDEYLSMLADDGLFDFYDISAGGYHTGERYVPPQVLPWAPLAEYSKRAMRIVDGRAVIIMAHRVNTVARAEKLLEEGVADLIGIARGHMADPELVNKSFEGREDEINLCVGSNECVYNAHKGMGLVCTVNPAAGREKAWGIGTLNLAEKPKRVVIVGAGPSGMKTAVVAARRGFDVTLLERNPTPGGSLQTLGSLPHHGQWNALTDQLVAQLDLARVSISFGVDATRESILALEPASVVFATGSEWDRAGRSPGNPGKAGITGADTSDRVFTIEEAVRAHLENPGSLGPRIVMMDETGAYLPLGAAELFTDGEHSGTEVTIITRRHMVGEIPKETWELPLLRKRIGAREIASVTDSVIESVEGGTVVYRDLQNTRHREITGVTALVICGIRYARRDLYDLLAPDLPESHLAGDSLAPRRPADAVYDGERVGRLL